ncbi:MAG: ATP-binding protein [Pseudomonadota bacterium]
MTVLRTDVPGTPEGVRNALAKLCDKLHDEQVAEDRVRSVELVVAEALNNIVEHALKDVAAPTIRLSMDKTDQAVAFEICDCGTPMPGNQLPPGTLPDIGDRVETYPEGGFGWHLIKKLTVNLRYDRLPGENKLSFQLPLSDEIRT